VNSVKIRMLIDSPSSRPTEPLVACCHRNAQPVTSLNNPGGGSYVVDDRCHSDSFVAAGAGEWLYDG